MTASFCICLLGITFFTSIVECRSPQPSCQCPESFQPVCGQNLVTYKNICELKCHLGHDAVSFYPTSDCFLKKTWILTFQGTFVQKRLQGL